MLAMFRDAVEAGETVADINLMAFAYSHCGLILEYMGRLSEAVPCSLEGLSLAEKTDSPLNKGIVYGALVRQYTFGENAKLADEYFSKMAGLPQGVLRNPLVEAFSKAVYLAGKGMHEEAAQCFQLCLKLKVNSGYRAWVMQNMAWALRKRGRNYEAKKYKEKSERIIKKIEETVAHVDVQASLIAPAHVQVNQKFDVRCDLTNVSKKQGTLNKVESLLPSPFKIVNGDSAAAIQGKKIGAFKVESISLTVTVAKPGTYPLRPKIVYADDYGKIKICKPKAVSITVMEPAAASREQARVYPLESLGFKSKDAKEAFGFLINAFEDDYLLRKLPLDRSGWRTLVQIAKAGLISQYSLYGSPNRRGPALLELEHLGLVIRRYFPGERGRGGKILKLRVAYEKDIVRRHINLNG